MKMPFHAFLLQEHCKPSKTNLIVTHSYWHITPCLSRHGRTENGESRISNWEKLNVKCKSCFYTFLLQHASKLLKSELIVTHSHWQTISYPIHHRPLEDDEWWISNWKISKVIWKSHFTLLLQEQGKSSKANLIVIHSHWHIIPCTPHHPPRTNRKRRMVNK